MFSSKSEDGATAQAVGLGHLMDEVETWSNEAQKNKAIRMKLLFPLETNTTAFVCKPGTVPYPVVVMFIGSFMESNRYQWLGERLVEECSVVYVVTDMVHQRGGFKHMMPIDGSDKPSETPHASLSAIFEKLKELNETGVLAGRLNLEKVIVGGHSSGGRVALLDATYKNHFVNIVGAFVYGAHAGQLPGSDVESGSMHVLEGSAPLLLIGGNKDSVLQLTGSKFGTSYASPMEPVKRTFEESIPDDRRCYYVELDGFNHMSLVDPEDRSVRSSMFDGKAPHEKKTMLDELYRLISLFIKEQAFGDGEAARQLDECLFQGGSPYVKNALRKG